MDKVTADTITDEQIRELREWCKRDRPKAMSVADYYIYLDCNIALGQDPTAEIPGAQNRALARCAEIWNARHASVADERK